MQDVRFCPLERGAVGVKIGYDLVHVVVECPLTFRKRRRVSRDSILTISKSTAFVVLIKKLYTSQVFVNQMNA